MLQVKKVELQAKAQKSLREKVKGERGMGKRHKALDQTGLPYERKNWKLLKKCNRHF